MAKNSLKILTILLLALAWLSPAQTNASAGSDVATFTITSLTNPSLYLVGTTFQVTATGTNTTYPPFGYVTFYSDGAEIEGCSSKYLNYTGSSPSAGIAAECTTSALAIGDHTITAYFHSYLPEIYDDATLTMTGVHTVSYTPLTISPDTLPDGQWMLGYSQTLTASGGDGSYFWSRSGDFPDYFTFYTDTGEMIGTPNTIGSSSFTVTVVDNAGGYGTKDYTLNITKATPNINVSTNYTSTIYADTAVDLYLTATASHPSSIGGITQPTGTVSFSVDGVAVTGCTIDITTGSSTTYCLYNTAGLAAGEHTVLAEFTPSDEYYVAASGTTTFTITPPRYKVTGKVFYDLDQDGVKDATESAPSKGFMVVYDIGCDGEIDQYTWSGNNISGDGEFTIPLLDSGASYCLFLQLATGEIQTNTVGPLTLTADQYSEIGVYYPDLIFSPTTLPYGKVNVPYSQTIEITNGTSPYTLSNIETLLPDGLTFDSSTVTLSGTATVGYIGYLAFDVTDASGFVDEYSSNVVIQADGTYTLTSSSNPSDSGEAVTFTFAGSGEGILAMYSTTTLIPPIGMVTFYDDGTEITGCTGLYLNMDSSASTIGDYPATCTVSALVDGEHVITASYVDMTAGLFADASQTLTQIVGAVPDTTPPVITPTIVGTLGSDGWYTSDVSLTWAVTDAESDNIAQTGCDAVSITSDQEATQYTCTATSSGGTDSVSITIKRDATKPVTTLSGVEEGALYGLGKVPQAVCTTTDYLSGVGTEAALSTSGGDARGLGSITATCSGALDVAGNAADPVSVTYSVTQPADLQLFLIGSRDRVRPGTLMTYTLIVANFGPSSAKSITLADIPDSQTNVISISAPRGWDCEVQSGVVNCTTDKLDRGRIALINVIVKVNKSAVIGQKLVNTANITSLTFDPYKPNNSDTVKTLISR